MLSIPEELYLLAIDEDKGVVVKSANLALNYALAGAILADLTLQNKVTSNDKGRLELIDTTQLGDIIADPVLQIISSSEKSRRLSFWISEISAKPKKLRRRIEESLVSKGIIIREDDRFVGIALADESDSFSTVKFQIKRSLRAGILAGQTNDLRSLALLGLARSSKLLHLIFTADEQRIARRRIQEAVVREALGNSTAQTIEEIDAAVSACLADA
jgi:golgi phosphoprotein 3